MKYVISLGGSLISPDQVDVGYLKKFTNLIRSQVRKGDKFYIVTGGGSLAREYQSALRKITKADDEHLDWIGIAATKMNAELVRLVFGNIAGSQVISDPTKKIRNRKPVQIISGWKPGRSSDYEAVLIAKNHSIDTVINLSNVDYVYNKDPKKYKKAEKIKEMTWSEFFQLFGKKWTPGANVPFDQTAAKLAKKQGIKVLITDGKKLKNLEKVFKKAKYTGTVIHE